MIKSNLYAAHETEESFEHARTLAGQALDLLVGHHVSPCPPHYAVAYEYSAGTAEAIRSIIDAHLRSGGSLDAGMLRELYDKHLSPERNRLFSSMGDELQGILLRLMQTLSSADEGASECHDALDKSIGQLQGECSQAQLLAVAGELLSAATRTREQNRALRGNLDAAKQEVAYLRKQIDLHRQEALTDPLTGLLNRRAFEDTLDAMLARPPGAPLSLLVLDIDHFKQINDNHGHAIGDIVLRHVAGALRKCVREADIAYRYGGEEFVILLPDTALDDACRAAENIRQRIAGLRLVRRQDNFALMPFTASLGVACRRPDDTRESLFDRADEAMYLSKSAGRDRVTRER